MAPPRGDSRRYPTRQEEPAACEAVADPALRRPENVEGPWFVDTTCIDCGTCMWMAPQVFRQEGDQSAVHRQAAGDDEDAAAALVACPTASIGGPEGAGKLGTAAFPRALGGDTWHLGFHDRSSFGATPYLARTSDGLVMVDVPRFSAPLARAVEDLGGLVGIALTHRDDVAAHERWHAETGAPRAIHRDDDVVGAETVLEGDGGTVFGLDWMHVPGHTKGSVVYRHGTTLFTGDHLAGSLRGGLRAFRRACWHDWAEQTRSMERLAGWPFERVLPGHGAPWQGTVQEGKEAMDELLKWMRTV